MVFRDAVYNCKRVGPSSDFPVDGLLPSLFMQRSKAVSSSSSSITSVVNFVFLMAVR